MTGDLRRGACPSLSAPMATGDGLLVRLNPRSGALRPRQLVGIAQAALRHGNGLLEITSRGSLQIRGLRAETVEPFTDAVAELAIVSDEGLELRTGALAGRDASEIADPLPLVAAIRAGVSTRGLFGRLAPKPKVSVVIDGGGVLGLGALSADIRIDAVADGGKAQWRLAVAGGTAGGRILLQRADIDEAVECCLACLAVLAESGTAIRSRDLPRQAFARAVGGQQGDLPLTTQSLAPPVGEFLLRDGSVARGFALAFGQIGGRELAALAGAFEPERSLRLAPGRGLLVLGLTHSEGESLAELAGDYGLVTQLDDPRLYIAACAGVPACASAHLPTKKIAAAIVSQAPGLLREGSMLHISGCSKKCSKPVDPSLELVGSQAGWFIEGRDMRGDTIAARSLARIAGQFGPGKRRSA